jgi:serine/threonine protein kinase/predicted RNA-binding protein with RPS1 domain
MVTQLINQTLGRYKILSEIGKGGMGKVYLAEHIYTGKKIALKTLLMGWLADLTESDRLVIEERFRREAQAAAQISHDNIVQIYDFDLPNGDFPAYISMELLEGESLEKVISSSVKFSIGTSISLMSQICAGVGAAHKKGLVHRDLKPANIIVIPPNETCKTEKIKIIDFGIAKIFDSDLTQITRSGQIIGTPKYMSPEQFKDESGIEIDERVDVYSLGLIFYELLTGSLPFRSDSVQGWMRCHLLDTPPELPDPVPTEIRRLIARSLEKDREKRPDSAMAFGNELEKFQFDQKLQLVEKQKLEEQIKIQQIIRKEKDFLELQLREQFEEDGKQFTTRIEEMQQLFAEERETHLSDLETMSRLNSFYDDGFGEIELLLKELKQNSISRIEERIEFYRREGSKLSREGQNLPIINEEGETHKSTTQSQIAPPSRPSFRGIGKKVRIYDLARDLKQDTKRVMEDLRREGADVSVPSNSVSVKLAKILRDKYYPEVESTTPKRAIKIIRAVKREDSPSDEMERPVVRPAAESPTRAGPKVFNFGTNIKQPILTHSPLKNKAESWETFVATYRPGDVVKGRVSHFTSFGVFVDLGEGVEGHCHISELADGRVDLPQDVVHLGQELDFKILRIKPDNQTIALSHRAVGKEDKPIIDTKMYSPEAKGGIASLRELADLKFGKSNSDES